MVSVFIRPPALSSSKRRTDSRRLRCCRSHRQQDALCDGFGQVGDKVGQIVHLHAFGGRQKILVLHVGDQSGADLVVDVHEGFTAVIRINQIPHDFALGRGQRFEQIADLGRMQAVQHPADGGDRAAVQRTTQAFERADLFGCGFGHPEVAFGNSST